MRLLWLELREFRNHARTCLDGLPEGLIVAVGPNGHGKSNLLEGVAFLFLLASPRISATGPLVRDGAGAAYARGEVETVLGRVLVEVEIPRNGPNRVKMNRSPVRRKRDVRRAIRAVFFGPDDLDVVRGEPMHRRRFLDEVVTALWPQKESAIAAYDRTLRQRNRLLKDWDGRGVPAGLDAWDEELTEKGCALLRLRAEAVARIARPAEREFLCLTGYGLGCEYRPVVWAEDLEGAFRARLTERRGDEFVRRTSLVGPHRDDVELAVRDLGARAFASHGEAWGAALCLRLGVAAAIEAEVGERPVVLLDDPFSALDPERRERVGRRLVGRGQVMVSAADEAHVPEGAEVIWDVAAGAVRVRGGGGVGRG